MSDPLTIGSVLMDLLRITVLLLPAMTANTFAPFLGGGAPVDGGRKRKDGRRYLGDGKTWAGFLGGSACATILGLLLLLFLSAIDQTSLEESLWGPFPWNILLIGSLAVGSLFGDMLGSFIKRALKRPRGTKTPLLDQWDYLIGATIFMMPFFLWFLDNFILEWHFIASIIFLFVAWLAHTIANWIGYWIGVKKEPW